MLGLNQNNIYYIWIMISFNFKKVLKNFYFLFFIFFLIWMLFIDSNGIRNRYYLNKKTNELSDEIDYYKREINNLELERKAFDKNDKLLEKYARENYMMKKKSEDIYYVSENQWYLLKINYDRF